MDGLLTRQSRRFDAAEKYEFLTTLKIDGLALSKIGQLDTFLTSFLGPRFCVYKNTTYI